MVAADNVKTPSARRVSASCAPKIGLVDPAIVRELIDYDPETGRFTWLPRDRSWFASQRAYQMWNTRFAGKPAFTAKDAMGYHIGAVNSYYCKAHRLAWAWVYGEWPLADIDHVNHDKADNRIANLRLADPASNAKNRGRQRNNASGRTGVHWHKVTSKWTAKIAVEGKEYHLGLFDSFEDAVYARAAKEKQLGFHPNHGKG